MIPIWLKASDLLLMPHPREIFYQKYVSPLKLFEYMCSNKPIIASNLEAIREILKHKKNAFLVEPGSPISISKGIKELIEVWIKLDPIHWNLIVAGIPEDNTFLNYLKSLVPLKMKKKIIFYGPAFGSQKENLLKSSVLLAALIVDALINPRDEQTSQQGDI